MQFIFGGLPLSYIILWSCLFFERGLGYEIKRIFEINLNNLWQHSSGEELPGVYLYPDWSSCVKGFWQFHILVEGNRISY